MFSDRQARTEALRRSTVTLAVFLGILFGAVVGCEDVSFNWGPEAQATPRPAGRPAGRVVTQSEAGAPAPAAQTAQASPRTSEVPTAHPSGGQASPQRSPLHVYQLVLFSEAGPAEAPPGIKHIRLQNARARDVANVLSLLYLPSGPSGTDHRFTLVYPTAQENELATEAARQLDIGIAAEAPAGDTAGDRWRWGVARAFAILDDLSIPQDRVRPIAASLATSAASSQLSRLQRWGAGMLAGELFTNRLYDYAAAAEAYRQADGAVEPGSYEQMALMYAKARALQQDGKRDQARSVLETLLGQFSNFRGAEVFERTRESLGQWERKR